MSTTPSSDPSTSEALAVRADQERPHDAQRLSPNVSSASPEDSGQRPPMVAHTATAYGDWVAELESSAPFLADHIYGDDVGTEPGARPNFFRRATSQDSLVSETPAENSDNDEHLRWARSKKWYRRPDERWLRPFAFLLALAGGMIMGPKMQIYYSLVCEEMGIQGISSNSILPPPQERRPVSLECLESPLAQAGQANLQLKLTLAMGLLSAITTGFWGGLSDRKGRTLVLRLAVLGLTINDIIFIAVGFFPQSSLLLGKDFLVVGAAIEGCLGGFATLAAGHQAYIADVTPNGTRATIFSFFSGILFFGFALGPSFGGWMSKATDSLVSPFYFALASHLIYLLFTILVLPESVSPERQQLAADEHSQKSGEAQQVARSQTLLTNFLTTAVLPLRPLLLFAPHRRHDDQEVREAETSTDLPATSHISVSRTESRKSDWNLTILALAFFIETACYGVLTPKFNYAQYQFHWDVQQLGYYLSFGSVTRVVCLALVIPAFIKWWHKPVRAIVLPHDGIRDEVRLEGETRHLLDDDGRPSLAGRSYGSTRSSALPSHSTTSSSPRHSPQHVEKLWAMRAQHLRQIHDSTFDKRLAIGSIGINAICYLLIALSRKMGPIPFVAITAFTSLGGAAGAAMSSLALALLERDSDAGKLFAAWSVLSAISTTLVGPVAFISLFAKTVSWAPESIFVLAFVLFLGAAITLSFVQVRRPTSLPSLPPRPHTSASLRMKQQQQQLQDSQQADGDTFGPVSSTKSNIRLRPSNPFGRQ